MLVRSRMKVVKVVSRINVRTRIQVVKLMPRMNKYGISPTSTLIVLGLIGEQA